MRAKVFKSQSQLGQHAARHVDALASRLRDARFDFLFRPGPWLPDVNGVPDADLDLFLQTWLGSPEAVVILDLSGLPSSILDDMIGALLRILYDALFWGRHLPEGARSRPLLIVLEEAHTYLQSDTHGPAKDAVQRIVKEGRKYGVGAMIVSQRPAEIDPTILSQCGTTIAMRLSNPSDRSHVASAVSDHMTGLLETLPALKTGEAIILGEAVPLPMRAIIDLPPPDRRSVSVDAIVCGSDGTTGWGRPRQSEDYAKIVRAWRARKPQSDRDA